MNAVYSAAITFTGQNHGAGKYDRIKIILRDCLILVTAVGLILGLSFWGLGRYLARCYSPDKEVIDYCMARMKIIMPTYFLCGIMDVMMGMLRGMGYSTLPTVNSFIGACMLRVVWIFTVFAADHSLPMLYVSYPVSWFVTSVAHIIMFSIIFKRCRRRSETENKAVADGILADERVTVNDGTVDNPDEEVAVISAEEKREE